MPSCLTNIKKFLKIVDLFPYSTFLRYNSDDYYSTSTGGIISIGIIVVFVILFASMGIKTVNKKIIYTAQASEFSDNPPELDITIGPQGEFLFGVFVFGVNLQNTTSRFFDIKMYQEHWGALLQPINSTQIPLVPCTPEHLAFNDQLKSQYYTLQFDKKLCPMIGQKVNLNGKVTSNLYSRFKLTISRCNATADPTCVSDATFNMMESMMNQWMVGIPFINYRLNPSQEEYKSFYIEDRNRFFFSSNLGTNLVAEIKQDLVQNDISLLPFQDIEEKKIVRVGGSLSSQSYVPGAGQPLLNMILRKSPETTTYSRSFNKFDQYFSYVGGLIGTIIGFMLIMQKYNEKAYEVSLAKRLFKDNDNNDIPSSSMSIGYYFLMLIKTVLDFFGCNPKWEKTQILIDSSQEVSNQLDITYIMRKLLFLDAAFSKLLEKHEIQALCLRQKPTLEKAKQARKTHFAYEMLQKFQKEKDGDQCKSKPPEKLKQNESMSEIMIESPDLKASQNIPEKSPEQKDKKSSQDASQIEISEGEEQVNQIAFSVRKVVEESLEGRTISKKILEQINELTLQQIGVRAQRHEVAIGNSYVKEKEEGNSGREDKKEKQKGDEEFQYNFDS